MVLPQLSSSPAEAGVASEEWEGEVHLWAGPHRTFLKGIRIYNGKAFYVKSACKTNRLNEISMIS